MPRPPGPSDLQEVLGPEELPEALRLLVQDYQRTREGYDAFRQAVAGLSKQLLADGSIWAEVTSRCKDLDSLTDKLSRKTHYHSLEDIPDLAGVRIVVRYLADVQRVVNLLRDEFEVCESVDHASEAAPESFGYLSYHLVLKMTDSRRGLREWRKYSDLKCEIQVRTILQHAWASISHTLDYKSEDEVPQSIRRDLFKVAALLESSDDMFDRYRAGVEGLRNTYANAADWRVLPVDVDSLVQHFTRLDLSVVKNAVEAGGFKFIDTEGYMNRGICGWIARACAFYNIPTLGDLNEYLRGPNIGSMVEGFIEDWQVNSDKEYLVDGIAVFGVFTKQSKGNTEILRYLMADDVER